MILKARAFWPLFWTQFLGALNDNILKNAMVIMIEYLGLSVAGLDAPSIVALSGGIFILPYFLFSMMAGQIADKYDKSDLVRVVKLWELLITVVASLGFFNHSVSLLLGALFMMGMHSTLFGPVKYSALPDLVPPGALVHANAYVEVGTFLAILLGTSGGGILILLPHGELWAAFALNLCAVLGLIACWRLKKLPSVAPTLKVRLSPVGPILEITRQLRRSPPLFGAILGISSFWFYGAALLALLPPFCKDYLHVDGHVLTVFLAMFTLGIGAGCITCARVSRQKVELGLVPLGTIGMTIFLLDLARTDAVDFSGLMPLSEFVQTSYGWRLLLDYLLLSVASGFFILPLYTLMQERSEKEFRSRVIAGNNVFNAIFMVASAVGIMLLHIWKVSFPRTFVLVAVINAAFCLYLFLRIPEFLNRWRKKQTE